MSKPFRINDPAPSSPISAEQVAAPPLEAGVHPLPLAEQSPDHSQTIPWAPSAPIAKPMKGLK